MGIIRFILFGVVFYYLLKYLLKILGVFAIKKAQSQYRNGHNSQGTSQKEGDISIKHKPDNDKKHVKGGDYVDFEEVD